MGWPYALFWCKIYNQVIRWKYSRNLEPESEHKARPALCDHFQYAIWSTQHLRKPGLIKTEFFAARHLGLDVVAARVLKRQASKNPKTEISSTLERNKNMGDMPNSTAGSAGSKIFVGGLDRSVDEGLCRFLLRYFQAFSHFRSQFCVICAGGYFPSAPNPTHVIPQELSAAFFNSLGQSSRYA